MKLIAYLKTAQGLVPQDVYTKLSEIDFRHQLAANERHIMVAESPDSDPDLLIQIETVAMWKFLR